MDKVETLARDFHERYEALAPQHGYETRSESAVPWDEVPEHNRNLMMETIRPWAEAFQHLELELKDQRHKRSVLYNIVMQDHLCDCVDRDGADPDCEECDGHGWDEEVLSTMESLGEGVS